MAMNPVRTFQEDRARKTRWKLQMGLLASVALHCLALCSMSVNRAEAFEIQLVHRPESAIAPFELTWPSVPGKFYDILAVAELGQPWKSLLETPIVALSSISSWVDRSTGPARFYLVVERNAGEPRELSLDTLEVVPARANLIPGGRQAFRVATAGDGGVVWSVASPGGADQTGTIDASGRYTAPASMPEIPVVLIRASRPGSPANVGFAILSLHPGESMALTREQAVEIARSEVFAKLGSPADAAMFGLHDMAGPEDVLQPFRPQGAASVSKTVSSALRIGEHGGWYFLVDEAPLSGWIHPVIHVVVDARTGAVAKEPDFWFALLNGQPVWNQISERFQSGAGDVVALGESLSAELRRAPAAANAGRSAGQAAEVPPIPRTFPPDPLACPCAGGTRYHGVIAVLSPEESALVRSARAMEAVLKGNRFSVTTLVSGGSARLVGTLEGLRSSIRPCDVLVVMVLGHGSLGSVQGMSAAHWAESFRAIPTNARYLIVEACDAGWLIEQYATEGRLLGVPPATLFTASNKALLEGRFPLVGQSPLYNGSTLFGGATVFTDALISCFSRYDALEDIHACLTSNLDLPLVANRLKIAGPQLARLGDPDADHDGIVDKAELAFGFDPANPDSDGDGICDGIEWGRIPSERINNLQRIAITTPANLGEWPEAGGFSATLSVANAVAPTAGAPSESNPYGTNPLWGWRVASGSSLPPSIVLDRTRGRLAGRLAAAGTFKFTLEHLDAAGALARREFQLTVRAPAPNAASGAVILVTTAADGNVRDHDLTLREALLLASGRLKFAELRPDPNPSDGKVEGEQAWVTGLPGLDRADTIQLVYAETTNFVVLESLGPLLMEGRGDHLLFDNRRTLFAAEGPALVLSGSDNVVDNALNFQVGTGVGVRMTGRGNRLNSVRFQGAGTGVAIELQGTANQVVGARISGVGLGIRVSGELGKVDGGHIADGGDGLTMEKGAEQNTVTGLAVGFRPAESIANPAQSAPLRGSGIQILGGARSNLVDNCAVAACGSGGIRIRGVEADFNQVTQCSIGDLAGGGLVKLTPNSGFGVAFEEGARSNRVTGGTFSGNLGPSLLFTGTGTLGNFAEASPQRPFGPEFTSTEPERDAVRVDGGAAWNLIRVRILESRGDGVVFSGLATRSNVVTATIRKVLGAGLRTTGGASDNVIVNCSVADSGAGWVAEGPDTRRNWARLSSFTANTGDGILWREGASDNRAGPGMTLTRNQGHGWVVEGRGTSGNRFDGDTSTVHQNTGYGAVFRGGASGNQVSDLHTSNNRAGSVLFTGAETSGNRLLDATLLGGLFPAEVALTGAGVTLADGARSNSVLRTSIQSHGGDGVLFTGTATASNRVAASVIQANLGVGARLDQAPGNWIGGEGAGNLITANGAEGVRISGAGARGNRVQGNTIGAERAGNASHGVLLKDGARENQIGGARIVRLDPRSPSVLLRPGNMDLGAGNRISANAGDGVRVEGADTQHNRIQGNVIGAFSNIAGVANAESGVTLQAGAGFTRVGNGALLDATNPRLGNLIGPHPGAGVRIRDAATHGNAVRRNEMASGVSAARLAILGGANGSPKAFSADVDWPSGEIRGAAPAAGIVELFSDFPGDEAVYHLAARVGVGAFRIDTVDPARCENAHLIDRQRPVRRAAQWVTFTELGSQSTSSQVTTE